MKFLLDTNAVSEPQRPNSDPGYMDWLARQHPDDLAISVLTLGELRRGLTALDSGRRRTDLSTWLAEGMAFFGERVLPVDLAVASAWAEIWALHRRIGRSVGVVDELTAATALVHRLTVVTRNTRHFEFSGCDLLAPWSD